MKILTLFTGGTIACSSKGGVLSPDKDNGFLLLDMYRETDGTVDFTAEMPYSILSENLCAENFNTLWSCVSAHDLSKYDGVIVCHGTDTLQYTGAFLSLKLGLCETPVVLVSANYPLNHRRSNGFENFCAAVSFIKSGQGRGVFISYKNDGEIFANIHRASRALPHLPYSDDLFSLKNQPYGYVKNGVFVKNPAYSETADEFAVMPDKPLNKTVLYIRPYPGMKYPPLTDDCKAVLLDSYHSGTIRTDGAELENFCREAENKKIPVCLTGSEDGFNYESKQRYSELGIKVLPVSSPILAYVKLWLM